MRARDARDQPLVDLGQPLVLLDQARSRGYRPLRRLFPGVALLAHLVQPGRRDLLARLHLALEAELAGHEQAEEGHPDQDQQRRQRELRDRHRVQAHSRSSSRTPGSASASCAAITSSLSIGSLASVTISSTVHSRRHSSQRWWVRRSRPDRWTTTTTRSAGAPHPQLVIPGIVARYSE